ncbi:MAG TPA: sigma factor [Gemmatimonadaceae bacterium]|nr:sigma factor [Gemmatimonadaceae bacterium]
MSPFEPIAEVSWSRDDLVEAVRCGDVSGFESVSHASFGELVSYATTLLGSADDAQDVVQDVFVGFRNNRAMIRPSTEFRRYPFRGVRHCVFSTLDRRAVRARTAPLIFTLHGTDEEGSDAHLETYIFAELAKQVTRSESPHAAVTLATRMETKSTS